MRILMSAFTLGGVTFLAACGMMTSWAGPRASPEAPTVLAIVPANLSVSADPSKPVVITFSRPMQMGMETFVVLHEGGVTGSPVAGVATWSDDRTMMTFTPSAPLKARMTWTLHFSPGMRGLDREAIDFAACTRLGGRYVTAGMMGLTSSSGMMNGSWGSGMMGGGWRAADGSFGMIFSFTTA